MKRDGKRERRRPTTGTPSAISSPAARSVMTSADAADGEHRRDRRAGEAADDVRDAAIRPLGRNSPVASVSSLPSRAAIAAPSRPTQSVRFSVNGAAPGMPGADEAAHGDLGQRQQHDAAERERGEGVLGASRDRPASTCLGSCGRRLAPERPRRRRPPAPCCRASIFTKLLGLGAEARRRLGIERRHRQAAGLHRGDRVGVELRARRRAAASRSPWPRRARSADRLASILFHASLVMTSAP